MPPRPRSPRPRPTPARRPRVAGLAPTAPNPDGPARPSGLTEDPPTEARNAAAPAESPAPEAPAEAGAPAPDRAGSDRPALRKPRPPRPAAGTDERPRAAGAAPTGAAPADDGEPAARREPDRKRSRPRSTVRATEEGASADAAARADTDTDTDTGTDADADAAAGVGVEPDDAAAAAPARGLAGVLRRRAVPLLVAALVLFTGVAVVAGVQDARLRGTPAATNTALVDVGATAEVATQLSDAIETVYSYDFARLDENENAAREVITPPFAAEYDRLFGEVRARAPEQQAVVSATVTQSAVKEITGDRAVLVAFVDQHATRAAADAESQQLAAALRLTVTGERVDGRWKIAAATPL